MSYAIKAENVSIRYLTGDFKDIGLKEYVMRRLTHNYKVKEFWADKGVTFILEKGDMLGIIGSNGSGKSTLLKAVSGIMVPTEGRVEVNGKIAALLELASGFDSELTVHENAYLRGALLGYTRSFMDQKYDQIIEFAELQDFQERPFKQLSSGMKSRLAFSIACLVEPDILILDEVLSVGDGAFRKKSEAKMKEILKSGVTGVLVSHSVDQVRKMCNKILWLDHGKQMCFTDKVDVACDAYEEFLITKKMPAVTTTQRNSGNEAQTISGLDNEMADRWNGIENLALDYQKRLDEERAEKEKTEEEKFLDMLKKGNKSAAVAAAKEFLKQNM